MPKKALPYTRSVVMPPSPPKNSGNISAMEATSSPIPSVIMAKVVPDFLVVTKPSRMAKAQHAALPQQDVVGQADDDQVADLLEHGQRQAAAKQHGRHDEHDREQRPDDEAPDVPGLEPVVR